MANLLASVRTAAKAMKAYETALSVVQNNVTNATSPGYVKQEADLVALAFQPELHLTGGVKAESLVSSRNAFSERAVWQQAQRNGRASQLSSALNQVEPIFDIASDSGIAGALDRLYGSFSLLSITPNDLPARQEVIRQAEDVAREFNFVATSMSQEVENARREVRSTVGKINALANDIRDLNLEFRQDYRKRDDAGLDARMHAALEQLASLVDFNSLPQADGTMTILLGGQAPLVIGDKVFEIAADLSGTQVEILDFNAQPITDQISQGKLQGVLEYKNTLLPSYFADLNRLAQSVADRFNTQLAAGIDLDGLAPATDLFTYDPADPAITLAVTGIQPREIAAAAPGAPGGNTNALSIAAVATSQEVDGFTFTEFYGNLAARVGSDISTAQDDARSSSLLLSQALALRDQESAVNLDEEAAVLLQYQRAYQAAARMVSIMDEMTEIVLQML